MASIVKRGKTYSVVYYEGEGKKRQQKWESGLTYSAAKAMKAKIEHEQAQQTAGDELPEDAQNELSPDGEGAPRRRRRRGGRRRRKPNGENGAPEQNSGEE